MRVLPGGWHPDLTGSKRDEWADMDFGTKFSAISARDLRSALRTEVLVDKVGDAFFMCFSA